MNEYTMPQGPYSVIPLTEVEALISYSNLNIDLLRNVTV